MTEQQIDRDRLRALAENATEGPWEVDRMGDLVSVPERERDRYGGHIFIGTATGDASSATEDAEFIAAARTAVPALLDMLDHSCVEPAIAASLQRRQRVVARAREYILAHRAEAITVPELCEQVHVSRRTLQYCFEDVLGMSPMLYLRMMRLNGVRRQLHDPAARGSTIGDVAGAWGMCNFSQFSSDYRKLFGVRPSAALKAGM